MELQTTMLKYISHSSAHFLKNKKNNASQGPVEKLLQLYLIEFLPFIEQQKTNYGESVQHFFPPQETN